MRHLYIMFREGAKMYFDLDRDSDVITTFSKGQYIKSYGHLPDDHGDLAYLVCIEEVSGFVYADDVMSVSGYGFDVLERTKNTPERIENILKLIEVEKKRNPDDLDKIENVERALKEWRDEEINPHFYNK